MKIATIDVGTNTTLLLVADARAADDVRVLADHAEITRLGRGIGKDGRLGQEGIDRTLNVLRDYARRAGAHGATIHAIGTEALRRAPNAGEFLIPAAAILGTPLQVIDGTREATLTFLAATTSFPDIANGPIVVIDIGGGSTEVVVSEAGRVVTRVSLPVGAVRLTEQFVHSDPPTAQEAAAIDAALARQLRPLATRATSGQPFTLIGTAGTVTTLAAMAIGLASYDPARVHGYRLDRTALATQLDRLAAARQIEREGFTGLDPRRADVIFAGGRILNAFVQHLGVEAVLVNDRGIRWGLLYEILAGAKS